MNRFNPCDRRIWLRIAGGLLLMVLVAGAYLGWSRGFREAPQPAWVFETADSRYRYGSIGAEHEAGIPYWIFYVLPRVFPEKFRQDGQVVAGGYAALGVAWEQGQELPIGFTKKTIGFPRVGNNCAVCHNVDGKGNQELGAPNLTDRIWLYGGDEASIVETITNARAGVMPAWVDRLDPVTIKALAVYVHTLGGGR